MFKCANNENSYKFRCFESIELHFNKSTGTSEIHPRTSFIPAVCLAIEFS